jgi:hypothetical protein
MVCVAVNTNDTSASEQEHALLGCGTASGNALLHVCVEISDNEEWRTGNRQRRVVRCAARVGAELCRVAAVSLQAGGARFGSLCGRARSLGHGLEPPAKGGILLQESLGSELQFAQRPCKGALARGDRVCIPSKRSAQDGVLPQCGGAEAAIVRVRN